jgi:hypothetical protein
MGKVTYLSEDCKHRFSFDIIRESQGYQVYVIDYPPIPAKYMVLDRTLPGCEYYEGRLRIRWFSDVNVTSDQQVLVIVKGWAEDLIVFLKTGIWRIPYYTKSGKNCFIFSIEVVLGQFNIYIEKQPEYGNRSTSAHKTHRHYDGRHYICWTEEITSYSKAEQIAATWSECTEQYILNSTEF